MRIHISTIEEKKAIIRPWVKWFAWHPVRCEKTIIWLETIERRHTYVEKHDWWRPEYRVAPTEGVTSA